MPVKTSKKYKMPTAKARIRYNFKKYPLYHNFYFYSILNFTQYVIITKKEH